MLFFDDSKDSKQQLDIQINDVAPFTLKNQGLNEEILNEAEIDANLQQYVDQEKETTQIEELNNIKKNMVKDRILKYVIGNKVNQVISFMLSHYSEDLSKEVLDMIKEEIRTVLSSKLKLLLDSALSNNYAQWCTLLNSKQGQEQMQQFEEVRTRVREVVQGSALSGGTNEPVLGGEEAMDEVAKALLHMQELKQELARLVSSLIMQARRGMDTESSQASEGALEEVKGNSLDNYLRNRF